MTKKLTLSAVMIAIATVLSVVAVYKLPNGGSVTFASMVPIIIVTYLLDFKWGILTCFAYSILQMVLGFYAPPVQNLSSFLIVILFDYVIAYGCLCLAGPIFKTLGKNRFSIAISGATVLILRFICHFISGVTIWKVYAEGKNPILFSLGYNGSYMLPELIITVVVLLLLSSFILRQVETRNY